MERLNRPAENITTLRKATPKRRALSLRMQFDSIAHSKFSDDSAAVYGQVAEIDALNNSIWSQLGPTSLLGRKIAAVEIRCGSSVPP